MSKDIVIDKQIYTRTKKNLKKALEEKGSSFTLSEISDILAKSFGFKNEFDMQRRYFDVKEENISKNLIKNNSYINPFDTELKSENSIENGIIRDDNIHVIDVGYASKGINEILKERYEKYKNRFADMDKILSTVDFKRVKGNVLVIGGTGSGTTTVLKSIVEKGMGNISTIHSKMPFGIIDTGCVHIPDHLENVYKLNKLGKNVVFNMHGYSSHEAFKIIESMKTSFDINTIKYIIITTYVNEKQSIDIYKL